MNNFQFLKSYKRYILLNGANLEFENFLEK